jgi:exodeoxyribonuclease-3
MKVEKTRKMLYAYDMNKKTFLSWNVNGLRASYRKGFLDWLEHSDADVVALQETKISSPDQLVKKLRSPDEWYAYFHCAVEKKGYSGTAIYTREKPEGIKTIFKGYTLLGTEGRVIEVQYEKFTLLNVYFPNGGGGEERLAYKLAFYDEFLSYIKNLAKQGKKVIFCGDINTAHNEIDLARPKDNEKNTGFLRVERDWMDTLELSGFVDTFRKLHPEKVAYSYWDMKTRARDRNVGWRIDYFFVHKNIEEKIKDAFILGDVLGSDHCPVGMTLDV